jgi:hypothetical protein
MKKIYAARSEADLVVVRSLLDAEGIAHFVHNESFGSTMVGPRIDNYNVKSIMVADDSVDHARSLLSDFESPQRMIAEMLLFAWFVPGRRRSKQRDTGTTRRRS